MIATLLTLRPMTFTQAVCLFHSDRVPPHSAVAGSGLPSDVSGGDPYHNDAAGSGISRLDELISGNSTHPASY